MWHLMQALMVENKKISLINANKENGRFYNCFWLEVRKVSFQIALMN
jgi:hypothetical protein